MKALIVSTALALLAALPAHAQWEPPDEVLQVRIQGKGAWSVRCEYPDSRSKTVVREANGRGDRLHLSALERGGTCTYRAAPDQPLTIRLKSPLYRCTLPARSQAMPANVRRGCVGSIPGRQAGLRRWARLVRFDISATGESWN